VISTDVASYCQEALESPAIGSLERLAVRRHLNDLDSGSGRGLVFDEQAALRAIGFFGFLRHSKGEWSGQRLQLVGWEQFIVWCLFGWKVRATGLRRFRTAYICVGRKNGKSTVMAGLGHYLFLGDGEPGAEVYTAATKRDQARIIHEEAKRMVLQSPDLRELIDIRRDHLIHERSFSKYEPLGADADTLDGLNPHGVLIDELHAHKTRELWDVLDTATDARRQPMLIAITTAGHNRAGIGYQTDEDACAILRGDRTDDSMFAFVARMDKGDDWRDEAVWRKANPNLGISVKIDGLRNKARKAATLPSFRNAFLQKHMNVWTSQQTHWLNIEDWDTCKVKELPDLTGIVCHVGLDVGTTRDLAALVLVFPMDDETIVVLPFFWCSETAANSRALEDRKRFQRWIDEGYIETTPGMYTDVSAIRKRLIELDGTYNIDAVVFDPWNAKQLATELAQEDGFKVIDTPQSASRLNEPSRLFESKVVNHQFIHDGNPVMRWCVENCSVKTDINGNIKPIRPDHLTGFKIDGAVAAIMAMSELVRAPEAAESDIIVLDMGV